MIVLICGYSRHGKDFLYDKLSKGTASEYYNVFPSRSLRTEFQLNSTNIHRIALATKLKQEVAVMMNLTVENLERLKDSPLPSRLLFGPDKYFFRFLKAGNLSSPPTYRDILIDHGQYLKSLDPYHWVKAILPEVKFYTELGHDIAITDFRFIEEFQYLTDCCPETKIVSIRVHRSNGPEPSMSIAERSLDNFDCSYLFLARPDHPQNHRRFPWSSFYHDFS